MENEIKDGETENKGTDGWDIIGNIISFSFIVFCGWLIELYRKGDGFSQRINESLFWIIPIVAIISLCWIGYFLFKKFPKFMFYFSIGIGAIVLINLPLVYSIVSIGAAILIYLFKINSKKS